MFSCSPCRLYDTVGAEVTIAAPFFPDDRTMLLLVLKFKRHLKLKESKKKKKNGSQAISLSQTDPKRYKQNGYTLDVHSELCQTWSAFLKSR